MPPSRKARPTLTFTDEYCQLFQSLFPEVQSFEAFKFLHPGLISRTAEGSPSSSNAAQMDHGSMSNSSPMPMDHGSMTNMNLGPADESFDLRFIDTTTLHHKGTVAIAQEALQTSNRPEVKQLAQAIIDTQEQEIFELKE